MRWNVTVAAMPGREALADAVCQRLTRAWRCGIAATFQAAGGAGALEGDSIRTTDAVILIADSQATQSVMLSLLNMLDEAGVPVLALLGDDPGPGNMFEFAGAAVDVIDAPDDRLCAVLTGLLHRQREVKRLRGEVSLSQRFHGGLKSQIARMHEELQLAAVVQREFLPRDLPSMHGVEVAALWRPSNYVSGDIYDVMRLDEDHIGIFIADAVGHGVPAALMTMVICRSLITKEITGNSYRIVPPSEVLARLNAEMIRRQGRTTRFTTAVYAVLNCRSRALTLAGAGHPPPVRLKTSGESQLLETTGGLLGVFPDEMFSEISVELHADDRLLFYTDGFEQAFPAATPGEATPAAPPFADRNYNRRLPTTQYRTEFSMLRAMPSALEMVEAISQRLDDQDGSLHQIDDLTLICVLTGALMQERGDEAERRAQPRDYHDGDAADSSDGAALDPAASQAGSHLRLTS
jgi:sigma-B regulation protein RsbU (phosphoserine phosphatase)